MPGSCSAFELPLARTVENQDLDDLPRFGLGNAGNVTRESGIPRNASTDPMSNTDPSASEACGSREPTGITHAIDVEGCALAFLIVTSRRDFYSCDVPLTEGWYALHVKPAKAASHNLLAIDVDIPPDLPVNCIIAAIKLGPVQSPSSALDLPIAEGQHSHRIVRVITLARTIHGDVRNILSMQMQMAVVEALPDNVKPPHHKRPRVHVGDTPAAQNRCQDEVVKAELRAVEAERERQRCEESLERLKTETAARIEEEAQDKAKCIKAIEKAAKQRFDRKVRNMKRDMQIEVERDLRAKIDQEMKVEVERDLRAKIEKEIKADVERDLRAKIEQEMKAKYDEELHTVERARVGSLQGVEWQYEFNGRWCAFDAASTEQLLRAYVQYSSSSFQKHMSTTTVASGSHRYRIDFDTMQQTNLSTSKSRAVRLKCEVPDTWQKASEALVWQPSLSQMHTQETDAEIWDIARQLLQETAHTANAYYPSSICCQLRNAGVVKIRRVENHLLWRRYQQHIAEMEVAQAQAGVKATGIHDVVGTLKPELAAILMELSGESFRLNQRVNEKWLLHGTDIATVNKIIEGGFDPRVSNTAGFYGAGTYFSSQSCKCHQYTSETEHTVLLCRVALGIPFYTKRVDQSLRRPPPLKPNSQHLHGCIVANIGAMMAHHQGYQAHQEFVIFDGAQAFPQYAISYRL